MKKYPSWLGSSADQTKVSRTFKSLVPLVMIIFAFFNVEIEESIVEEVLLSIAMFLNGAMTLYYALERVKNWWKKR